MTPRQVEVGRIIDEHWGNGVVYHVKRTFIIRGPLTVAQVESELIRSFERAEIYGVTVRLEDTSSGKFCERLQRTYQVGDELYFFVATDEPSWSQCHGYMLIRGNAVSDGIVTGGN
jgi:hypothetical protein